MSGANTPGPISTNLSGADGVPFNRQSRHCNAKFEAGVSPPELDTSSSPHRFDDRHLVASSQVTHFTTAEQRSIAFDTTPWIIHALGATTPHEPPLSIPRHMQIASMAVATLVDVHAPALARPRPTQRSKASPTSGGGARRATAGGGPSKEEARRKRDANSTCTRRRRCCSASASGEQSLAPIISPRQPNVPSGARSTCHNVTHSIAPRMHPDFSLTQPPARRSKKKVRRHRLRPRRHRAAQGDCGPLHTSLTGTCLTYWDAFQPGRLGSQTSS